MNEYIMVWALILSFTILMKGFKIVRKLMTLVKVFKTNEIPNYIITLSHYSIKYVFS